MSLLTMTDCADADNRVQARYELERAFMTVGTQSPADWAIKWGRALLDYADVAPSEDDVCEEIKRAETDATNAEDKCDALTGVIEKAIKDLDAIDTKDAIRNIIDDVVADLENSL